MKKTFLEPSRVHVALNTSHFDEAVEFYSALLNTNPSKLKAGYAKFEGNHPPVNLTLNEAAKVEGNQINHLGIEVKAGKDVERQTQRFKKLGLEMRVEERTTCCYAVQDKVWVTDPDGNAWETFVVFEDTEEKYGDERSVACCG